MNKKQTYFLKEWEPVLFEDVMPDSSSSLCPMLKSIWGTQIEFNESNKSGEEETERKRTEIFLCGDRPGSSWWGSKFN